MGGRGRHTIEADCEMNGTASAHDDTSSPTQTHAASMSHMQAYTWEQEGRGVVVLFDTMAMIISARRSCMLCVSVCIAAEAQLD